MTDIKDFDKTIGREIAEETIDRLKAHANIPIGYEFAIGVIVWWVEGYPYPSELAARKVADRIYQIYSHSPEVRWSIEAPEILHQAIQQRVIDRPKRAEMYRQI
jgi:hypothetical protein